MVGGFYLYRRMLKKVTVEAVKHTDRVSSKTGKKFVSCGICIKDKDGQDMWLNGFGDSITQSLQKGQEVELEIYKDEKYGWQFKTPKKTDMLESRLVAVEHELSMLKSMVLGKAMANPPQAVVDAAAILGGAVVTEMPKEISVDEIPF